MRDDEIFVMKVIEDRYLSREFQKYSIVEGDEPPDYYVLHDGRRIALEITQCVPVSIVKGEISSSQSIIDPIIRLIDSMNEKYKDRIFDKKIFLHITGPIIEFKKFKQKLDEFVSDLIIRNEFDFYDDFKVINIHKDQIKVLVIKDIKGKRISGAVGIKSSNHEFNIEAHIETILFDAIQKKYEKLSKLKQGVDEKWLGVLNNYFLSDLDTYGRVLKKFDLPGVFTKIFIVGGDGELLLFNSID